jgi:hypothetical protein
VKCGARAFAMLNMALHDAAVGCWDEVLLLQSLPLTDGSRPEVDHRPPTELPAYTSGIRRSLEQLRRCCPISFRERQNRLRGAEEEASISRLYGGIHFRSDLEVGKVHGQRIGGYTVSFARIDGADLR